MDVVTVDHRTYSAPGRGGDRRSAARADWTQEQRELALCIYAETGSLNTAERETGIPATTIGAWVNDEAGDDYLDRLRVAVRARNAHKYLAIVSASLDQAMDRIAHGNWVIDKRGALRRVPVPYKDLMFGASIATDKHALITGMMQHGRAVDGALNQLADKLVGLVGAAMDKQGIAPPSPSVDSELDPQQLVG